MKTHYSIVGKLILLGLLTMVHAKTNAQKKLYGMTYVGKGVFAYDLQTKQVSPITNFQSNGANGAGPYGSLIQGSNGKLYGMTDEGGDRTRGVIFEIDPATNIYTKLHSFDSTNGSNPRGSLLEVEPGVFYGMTYDGGTYNSGVVFKFTLSDRSISTIVNFKNNNPGQLPGAPYGSLIKASNGKLYGMTGAVNSRGIIFEIDPTTNTFVSKHSFGGTGNPSSPWGDLIEGRPGKLYGLTKSGGQAGEGTIFEYNMATATVTKLYQWAVTNPNNGTKLFGARPEGSLCLGADSMLYGVTTDGGFAVPGNGSGVLFKFNPDSNTYTKLQSFEPRVGNQPKGTLTLASNGKFYGTVYRGGMMENKDGGIFEYDPVEDTMILVHAFQANDFQDAYHCKLLEVDVMQTSIREQENLYFQLYPNPVNSTLYLNLSGIQGVKSITLFDVMGKALMFMSTSQNDDHIDVSGLPPGMYIVQIQANGKTATQRIVKY